MNRQPGPLDVTVECSPSTRQLALAFVGRECYPGFVITPSVQALIEPFALAFQFALRCHKLDMISGEPGCYVVVRRMRGAL